MNPVAFHIAGRRHEGLLGSFGDNLQSSVDIVAVHCVLVPVGDIIDVVPHVTFHGIVVKEYVVKPGRKFDIAGFLKSDVQSEVRSQDRM